MDKGEEEGVLLEDGAGDGIEGHVSFSVTDELLCFCAEPSSTILSSSSSSLSSSGCSDVFNTTTGLVVGL